MIGGRYNIPSIGYYYPSFNDAISSGKRFAGCDRFRHFENNNYN